MAVAFTATPDTEHGRVEIRATGGTPGDSFYILRRDRNGSNLTRETAEAGVVWQPDPASTRHNLSTNPSCEVNGSGWAQVLGAGSLTVKNYATNPYFAPNTTELEYSRNVYANPFFFGSSGNPLGSATYAYLAATGSKSSSYDDASLTITASAMAANSRYGLRQDGVSASGGANVPVTLMYDYVKTGGNATVVMYADFRSSGDTSVQSFRLEGEASSGSLRMQAKPSGAWARMQVYFWLENKTTSTIAGATTVVVTRPGVITGVGGWNTDSAEQFGGINDFGDGTDVSWAGTAHNSTSIRKSLGVGAYTSAPSNLQPISIVKNGVQSLALMSQGGATAQNTWVSPGGDSGAVRLGLVAGKTYKATGTIVLDGPLTGTLNADARSIVAYTKVGAAAVVATKSNVAPNVAGSTECSVTFTVPAGATEVYIRLMGGATLGEGAVFWSNFNVFESSYTGAPFTGDDQNTAAVAYNWDGTPNASSSTKTALVGRQLTDAAHGKWAYQSSWAFAPAVNTTANGIKHTSLATISVGGFLGAVARVRSNVAKKVVLKLETFNGATLRNSKSSTAYTLVPDVWTEVRVDKVGISLAATSVVVSLLSTGPAFGADESIQMDRVLIEPTATSVNAGLYFDGSSFDPAYNGWDGAVGLSSSYLSPGSIPITIYDYEARQGLDTDYILTDELGNVGASVSVLIPRWGTWLKDPFRPFMNCKVLWHQDSEYERKARRSLLQPRNAKYPVPQWDRRIAPSANIEVATEEDAKARALTSLLDSAGVIMIDVDDRFGVPVRYVSVGDIKGRRVTSSDSLGLKWEARIWNLEIDEVAYPIGTPSGQSLTYSEVAGFFSSYIDIAATVASYDELSAGTWKTDV